MFISEAFAQTAPAASGGTESSLLSLLPLLARDAIAAYFAAILRVRA